MMNPNGKAKVESVTKTVDAMNLRKGMVIVKDEGTFLVTKDAICRMGNELCVFEIKPSDSPDWVLGVECKEHRRIKHEVQV